MDIFSAVIQGIIQGLTEFLPVSSSGHLTITQHIFGMQQAYRRSFRRIRPYDKGYFHRQIQMERNEPQA